MGRRNVSDVQADFAGGLNATSSDVALLPNQVTRAINARLTQFGGIKKRGGTQRMTSAVLASASLRGVTEWTMSDGVRYILASCDGTLYRASYGSFPITFTAITGAVDATATSDFVAFRDSSGDAMYVADGGLLNKVVVTAGPTFTLTANIASTPIVTDLEVFNQRLWGCGSTAFPQAIFYSALNDGDTLGIGASGGGQINVRTFGQANVVALRSIGTSLLIFHRAGVSRLTGFGQDDTVAVPAGVTGEVGTIAPHSVVRIGNVAYYVNVRGLFVATAELVQPVNSPEKPDPLAAILPTLTETQLAGVSSVFYPATRELLIHVPSAGTYVFHTLLQSWAGPWTGTFLASAKQHWANAGTSDAVPVVLKGGTDGFIELVDSPNSTTDSATAAGVAGTGVSLGVTCRRQFAGDFADEKSYRWGYLLADLDGSTAAAISWQTDTSGATVALSQSASEVMVSELLEELITEVGESLATTTSSARIRVPVWGRGFYIDVSLQDDSVTSVPSFSRVEVAGFSLGRH